MKVKEKILRGFIFLIGIFCLYAFVAVRFEPLFNFVLIEKVIPGYWDKTKFGELYYFNQIKYFKEENLPPAKTKFQDKPTHASLDSSDIITFGDSYFDFSRNTQFPERLHNTLGVDVHFRKGDDILGYLEAKDYDTTTHRILIYERTERWIPLVLNEPPDSLYRNADPPEEGDVVETAKKLIDFVFPPQSEKLYDAMLRRSFITGRIYTEISTLKFDWFNYVSPYTPKYYLNDTIPWLFYYDQVNDEPSSFYYQHSDKEIDDICNNIVLLSNTLREKYNITFVFLPLPAKYTIYHYLLNNHKYNSFLPRLYRGLEENGILFVDVLQDYLNAEQLVYYGTDEHWTEPGISIAFNKTIKLLKHNQSTNKVISNHY